MGFDPRSLWCKVYESLIFVFSAMKMYFLLAVFSCERKKLLCISMWVRTFGDSLDWFHNGFLQIGEKIKLGFSTKDFGSLDLWQTLIWCQICSVQSAQGYGHGNTRGAWLRRFCRRSPGFQKCWSLEMKEEDILLSLHTYKQFFSFFKKLAVLVWDFWSLKMNGKGGI